MSFLNFALMASQLGIVILIFTLLIRAYDKESEYDIYERDNPIKRDNDK